MDSSDSNPTRKKMDHSSDEEDIYLSWDRLRERQTKEKAIGEPCRFCSSFSSPEEIGLKATPCEFRASAANGCAGCVLVTKAVDHFALRNPSIGDVDDEIWELDACSNVIRVELLMTCVIEIHSLEATPWPWNIPSEGRSLPRHTLDDESIDRILQMVSNCDSLHSCWTASAGTLPKRVIDVSKDSVRLYESADRISLYTCLSHCWAGHSHFVTTTSNLAERMADIPWNSLPKTFQDAIILTRAAGICYLWIDSLCIIQDDELDWQAESAKMASIYSNAYLTIASDLYASTRDTSADEDELKPADGCFSAVSSDHLSSELELPHPMLEGQTYTVGVRKDVDHRPNILGTRGWVYQERWLSHRYLWCQNNDVIFECDEGTDCLCGLPASEEIGDKSHLHQESCQDPYMWHSLVRKYSRLQLTYASDCFPALSGLAKSMGRNAESNYLAGLWKDSLVQDLLWENDDRLVERPAKWRAPTWSWASTYGKCIYDDFSHDMVTARQHVKVIDAHCKLKGIDFCGELSSGSIALAGRLITAKLSHGENKSSLIRSRSNRLELEFGKNMFIFQQELKLDYHPVLDTTHHMPSGHPVQLLLLLSYNIMAEMVIGDPRTARPISRCYGIVLRSLNEKEALYERVAYCQIDLKREAGGSIESRMVGRRTEVVDTQCHHEEMQRMDPWYEELKESIITIL